jgi:hypothetical protein
VEAEHAVAIVDLLLTVAYIDGRLAVQEQAFIRSYLEQLVDHFGGAPDLRARIDAAYTQLDAEIAALAAEIVPAGNESGETPARSNADKFTSSRLKSRAIALFHGFSPADQEVALALMDAVARTDGTIAPEEKALHDELRSYFHAEVSLVPPPPQTPPADLLQIRAPQTLALGTALSHPLLDAIEQAYAADPAQLHAQLANDYGLVFGAITAWEKKRSIGNGWLAGVTRIAELAVGTAFLDGHVHILRPDHPTELIVLGDLHGCYACLKAAVLQSNFIERALAHQRDPSQPDVKLVLLGDYIDRGRLGFEGVLRGALQLFTALPDHVYILRGNHEFLVRVNGTIVSAVSPAEAVPGIVDRVPLEILEAYRHLFEHMPTSLIFDRTLFVHGGIPRDDTIAERFHDLSSLDDSVVRFEMMWGDPLPVDRVAGSLQRESPRYGFGREQFRAFMDRIGAHTLIRGHEAVDPGFVTNYDLGHCRLHTLFSAGGRDNADLPPDSRYRKVTPMALTIRDGVAIPWRIEYEQFDDAAHSGYYR